MINKLFVHPLWVLINSVKVRNTYNLCSVNPGTHNLKPNFTVLLYSYLHIKVCHYDYQVRNWVRLRYNLPTIASKVSLHRKPPIHAKDCSWAHRHINTKIIIKKEHSFVEKEQSIPNHLKFHNSVRLLIETPCHLVSTAKPKVGNKNFSV